MEEMIPTREMLKLELFTALKRTRMQETYMTITEIADVIVEALGDDSELVARSIVYVNNNI